MKYKNVALATFLFLFSSFATLFITSGTAFAAAQCYELVTQDQLSTANPTECKPGSQAVSYVNINNVPQANPLDGRCYAGTTSNPGTSFVHTTYQEYTCNQLGIMLNDSREATCEASSSGGAWQNTGPNGPNGGGYQCVCPSGFNSANYACVRQDNTSEGESSGVTTVQTDGEGAKVFAYLQTGVNLLTGLAGLAITAGVIIGGIQYASAGGNPQAVAKARGRIINALVALLCLVFLYSFLQWLVPGGLFSS